MELARSLVDKRRCGRLKLFTTTLTLRARAARASLFLDGGYAPLRAVGEHRDHVFAFARRSGNQAAIACVPRLIAGLVGDAARPPVGADLWTDTRLEIPESLAGTTLRHVFTGAPVPLDGSGSIAVAALLDVFPVALLV
jgi:(1->4)-alpha-D-glucan 1-alpha-D-glucosylmutase